MPIPPSSPKTTTGKVVSLPFVIEYPDALRDHVRDLARRLADCAEVVG